MTHINKDMDIEYQVSLKVTVPNIYTCICKY